MQISVPSLVLAAVAALVALAAGQATTQAPAKAGGQAPATHWAFLAPVRPSVPAVRRQDWPRNDIDRFVLQGLEAHGLSPSPAADPTTLVRRLTLDLLGLPPTPAEVDAFVRDASAGAVERLVERLLQSPHFGERMALWWLDLARYADTHGFHVDAGREMWPWRDWVIRAFNRNQRFDAMTIEQLAGDLLPGATPEQVIASGFNRNHMINLEGGADAEEYAVRYVTDRVNTTSTTWLGLTVGCAECHDHKYDPISQREYYQLYAFFDDVPEKGLDGFFGNAYPMVKVPTPAHFAELARLQQAVQGQLARVETLAADLDRAQAAWEHAVAKEPEGIDLGRGLVAHFALEGADNGEIPSVLAGGPRASVVGTQPPVFGPGRIGRALELSGTGTHVQVGAVDVAHRRAQAFTISAWVNPQLGGVVAGRYRAAAAAGWTFEARGGAVSLTLSQGGPVAIASASVTEALWPGWNHVVAAHDGSGKAAGLTIWVNGERAVPSVTTDKLAGDIEVDEPLRIGAHEGEAGFHGAIDEVRVYGRVLSDQEVAALTLAPVRGILAAPPQQRSAADAELVREHFRRHVAPATREIYAAVRRSTLAMQRLADSVPSTMVMADLPQPRTAHIRVRGDYRRLGDAVEPDVLAVLPRLPEGAPRNRLTLARWLVDARHPLTARVLVNRLWGLLFGAGLVRTSDDFGVRGARPTHPELLDYLAVELVASGWDVKHMITAMVTSATYRQASCTSEAMDTADPDVSWLAHMRRRRLPAELVRDVALFAAGTLDLRLGGPGVRPTQPPGLWEEVAFGAGYSAQTYETSPLADRLRRGLYVYVKRSAPYAAFRAFDMPTRETCVVSRDATTTPMQALVLLNDPVYVEAARALAQRMLAAAANGDDLADDARLEYGFRLCVARSPSADERAVLRRALAKHRAHFAAAAAAAAALIAVGDTPPSSAFPAAELAAWTMLGSALLNKSETITVP